MKYTHKQRILDLLADRQWHSTPELNAICWSFGQRLWDLRREGYAFEKRVKQTRPRIEEWRLIAMPSAMAEELAPAPIPQRRRAVVAASGSMRPALTMWPPRAMNDEGQGELPWP